MMVSPSQSSAQRSGWVFIPAALAITLLGVLLEYPDKVAVFGQPGGGAAIDHARLYFDGPDDYMRTWRAKQIAEGSVFRIRHIAEINFPEGAELHWTAPMDYLLAGAGLVFSALFAANHADPFGCVAAWVPLGLGVIYLIYMMAVMRRGFGWQPAVLVGLMIVLSPSWHRVFRIGHPDHHCLIALLLLFAVGAWIPMVRADGSCGRPRRWAGFVGGLAMGAAIWVSVESMVFWGAVLVALWGACTFGPGEGRRAYARARFAWNCAVLVVLAAAHVFENWPDLGAMAADKISLLYVVIAAIGFLVPGGEVVRGRCGTGVSPMDEQAGSLGRKEGLPAGGQSWVNRYIALLAALAVFTSWMALRQSRVFEHVSRPEFTRWISRLMEFQPMYIHADSQWSLQPLHSLMGYLPWALPVLLVFFLRSKQAPRAAKYALAMLAPAIVVLAVFQLRWVDHFDLAVVPVGAIGAWELATAFCKKVVPKSSGTGVLPVETQTQVLCDGSFTPDGLNPTAVFGVVVLMALLTFPSTRLVLTYGEEDAVQSMAIWRRTDLAAREIIAYQREHPEEAHSRRRAILCEDGEGPALLYWTGLPVVATPYHRALGGLLEVARFFAERDPARAREQLDRLGVRFVVIPQRAPEQLMQFERMAFGELRSFDPPTESINQFGGLVLKLNYRPREVVQTMAYRLVIEPEGSAIPGVDRIAEINEGAKTPDGRPMKTGLLYVVNDLLPASRPAQD
jgi:hypothetical protein